MTNETITVDSVQAVAVDVLAHPLASQRHEAKVDDVKCLLPVIAVLLGRPMPRWLFWQWPACSSMRYQSRMLGRMGSGVDDVCTLIAVYVGRPSRLLCRTRIAGNGTFQALVRTSPFLCLSIPGS